MFSWDTIYEIFKPYFENELSAIDQVFLADFNGKLLYEWIPSNKVFEEFLGIKICSIFLTDDIIEYSTHIPWQKKFDQNTGLGKLPLRSILGKHKGFEKKLLFKKGFGPNLNELWDKNAKDIITNYVNEDSEIIKDNLINIEWLKKIEKDINDPNVNLDPRYINKMLSLLALEVWYRLFITKSLKSDQKL